MATPDLIEDQLGLRPLEPLTLGERVIDPDTIPWVPYEGLPGVFVKPLRLNRKTGVWANLTRVEGPMKINRHYHVGPVTGYVLEGSWHYAEKDWTATPGKMVWEPPGDIHTLIAGDQGTVTLFTLEGALLYVDDNDNVIGHDDVLSHMKLYVDYCASQGIEPVDLDY